MGFGRCHQHEGRMAVGTAQVQADQHRLAVFFGPGTDQAGQGRCIGGPGAEQLNRGARDRAKILALQVQPAQRDAAGDAQPVMGRAADPGDAHLPVQRQRHGHAIGHQGQVLGPPVRLADGLQQQILDLADVARQRRPRQKPAQAPLGGPFGAMPLRRDHAFPQIQKFGQGAGVQRGAVKLVQHLRHQRGILGA